MADDIRSPLGPGTVIFGDPAEGPAVKIDDVISSGGSCIVYRGTPLGKSGRGAGDRKVVVKEFYPLAIKSLSREKSTHAIHVPKDAADEFDRLKENFRRGHEYYEIDPNHAVAPPFWIGEDNNTVYAVSDPTIATLLTEIDRSTLTLDRVFSIVTSLASAIKTFHDNGYLYLDCKPDNVFFYHYRDEGADIVRLFDFDTVIPVAEREKSRYPTYSKGWAAPEQVMWNCSEFCFATDIYSIGMVLFWLLTGEKPTDPNRQDIDRKEFSWEIHSPFFGEAITANEKIEPTLNEVLKMTLKEAAAERYQTIGKLLGTKDRPGPLQKLWSLNRIDQTLSAEHRKMEKEIRELQGQNVKIQEALSALAENFDTAVPSDAVAPFPKAGTSRNPFSFYSDAESFFGRERETSFLKEFCDADELLLWTGVTGKGGIGKSKLIYHFQARMSREGWITQYCRKLDSELLEKLKNNVLSLDRNTIICFDDAKFELERIVSLLLHIVKSPGRTGKVRFILIDRSSENLDLSAMSGTDALDIDVLDYRYVPSDGGPLCFEESGLLRLQPLCDRTYRELFAHYLRNCGKETDSDTVDFLLRQLCELDPERRPLYALFIADAWCHGARPNHWGKQDAIKYVINNERARINEAVHEQIQDPAGQDAYKRAVTWITALACCCREVGLTDDLWKRLDDLFSIKANDSSFLWILRKIGSLNRAGTVSYGLEPDLVGEFYTLQALNEMRSDERAAAAFFDYALSEHFTETVRYSDKAGREDHAELFAGSVWAEHVRTLKIPASYRKIPKDFFSGCTFLHEILLHDRITHILAGAFQGCTALEGIVFPASLEVIEEGAFSGCSDLAFAALEDDKESCPSIISIGNTAFYGCGKLKTVKLPSSVQTIGRAAFEGCSSLEEAALPYKVEKIEPRTFKNCTSLQRVELPRGDSKRKEVSILSEAFAGCAQLSFVGGTSKVARIEKEAFADCGQLIAFAFSDQLREMEEGAFCRCSELEEADLSQTSLLALPARAFFGCKGLVRAVLPQGMKTIGGQAFEGCSSLGEVLLPSVQYEIGDRAFCGCSALSGLSLSRDVLVASSAFQGCKSLSFDAFRGNRKVALCGFSFSSFSDEEVEFLTSFSQQERVTVPSTVTVIGRNAFLDRTELRTVVLPSSVRSIGESAFCGCTALETVEGKDCRLTELGQKAFFNCRSLRKIDADIHIGAIEDSVFFGCEKLERVSVSQALTRIGDHAFAGCVSLRELRYRGQPRDIGVHAFRDCHALPFPLDRSYLRAPGVRAEGLALCGFYFWKIGEEEIEFLQNYWKQEAVTVPDTCIGFTSRSPFAGNTVLREITLSFGVGDLPTGLFSGCTSLESVRLPGNIHRLPDKVFKNCVSLKAITFDGHPANQLPNHLEIGKEAFLNCKALEEIALPSRMKTIPLSLFCGCSSLSGIVFPPALEEICYNAFGGCSGLRAVCFPPTLRIIANGAFKECSALQRVCGLELTQVRRLANEVFQGCTKLEEIKLPETLESIGSYCFFGCWSLTEVTLTDRVDSIGNSAFHSCYNLKEIKIPDKVSRIEAHTFKQCEALRAVALPETLTAIGNSAFYGCSSLGELRLPGSITQIGVAAFLGCRSLKRIVFPRGLRSLSGSLMEDCTALERAVLPDETDRIPTNCFKDCVSLKTVVIPQKQRLKKVSEGAFRSCASLGMIELPDGLEEIGQSAFRACRALTEIRLPLSIRNIPVSAFQDCEKLETVSMGEIRSCNNYAFAGCLSLKEIPISHISEKIGIAAFKGCRSLQDISFCDDLQSIEPSAFRDCRSVVSVRLPSHLKKVCGAVFREDERLKTVVIPSGVAEIGKSAFRDCRQLDRVELGGEPILIRKNAFRDCRELYYLDIPADSKVSRKAFTGCDCEGDILSRTDLQWSDEEPE